ncbi:MAG: AraC family transcriptional regulator [Lachnospiraceae bacterium]|nr:AraC family transcriptional regulator [Lachnospiraceae bacterium]
MDKKTVFPLTYEVCGQLISLDGFWHHRRCFASHVLIVVTEGTLYITSGGNPYTVSAGQYILLKAEEEHFGHRASTGRLSYMWVHFSSDGSFGTGSDGESAAYLFPEYGSVSVSGRVSLLFHQLLDLSLEEKPLADNMLHYALSLLVMELSREYRQSQKNGSHLLPAVVVSVMEWIKANYYQPFTVSELAGKFGYQADYLSSLFKKAAGVSIVRYTNGIRIKSAKTLLLNYELSIKETAYACGFSDEKYFMKVFRQSEGMTPTQYKKAFCKKYIN